MTLPADPLGWAVGAFRDTRARDYAKYRAYIAGIQEMQFATERFRQAFGRLFHTFAYNRCATVVTAHAERMRVSGIGANDEALNTKAQDLWDENQMDIRQGQLATEQFGMGDAYLLVEVHPVTGDVQMWPQSAEKVRVHYDEERPGAVDLAATLWRDEENHTRVNLYFTNRIEKYRSRTRTPSGIPSSAAYFERFEPDGDTAWPVRLPITDTVPIFPLHNAARVNSYGTSELRDVIGLQDALNKTLMDQMVAEEFTAYTQRVILNYDPTNDNERQQMDNLVAGLTRILAIPPPANNEPAPSIAEFSATDMKQYDLVAEKWDIRISRVTGLPVHFLTGQNSSVSGRAKLLDESGFITKMTQRQNAAEPVYAAALAYGLRLQGTPVDPGALRINWEPAAPLSEVDAWELAEMKVRTGLPLAAVLRELGYEPEQIETIMAERNADPLVAAAGF